MLSSTPGGAKGEPLKATYRVVRSGLTRMPRGRFPRGRVWTTRRDPRSMTLRSPERSFVTKRRGPGAGGGAGLEHATSRTSAAKPVAREELDTYGCRLNANKESPAPTTTYCRPSSRNVCGPLLEFAPSPACHSGFPVAAS